MAPLDMENAVSTRSMRRVATVLVFVLAPYATADAQGTKLASFVPNLLLQTVTIAPSSTTVNHTAHFNVLNDPNRTIGIGAIASALNFNRGLVSQLTTFPLGSSTGGFTFNFDEGLGTYERASSSFGPAFAERALTIGRKRLSVGFNYQHSSFSSLEGHDLNDGSLTFFLPHTDCCPAGGDGSLLTAPFEGDLVEETLALDASSDTFAAFANYGVTDRWDIGVAVPIVRVTLDATVRARVVRTSTAINLDVHAFPEGPDFVQETTSSAGATGLGDILIRSKFNFLRTADAGFAAAVDLRLPTGDEADLLGTGTTQAKVFLIASTGDDRFAQHFNIGYTFSGAGSVDALFPPALPSDASAARPDSILGDQQRTAELFKQTAGQDDADFIQNEINYVAGVEFVATPRVTLLGDVVGRTLLDAPRLEQITNVFAFNVCGPGCSVAPGGPRTVELQEFEGQVGNLNLLLGTVGAKVNVGGNTLLTGNLLFPLSDGGLKSGVSVAVGLDYAF